MAIKNKDGSIYELRKPNPLMKHQELWKDFQLHNFNFKKETVEDTTEVQPHESDFKVKDFVTELEESKPEPIVEKPVVVLPDLQQEKEQEKKPIFHCLPAVIHRHRDVLYGETYSTVKYDTPFSFEAYVIEQSDLILQFWTSGLVADKINEGSVIYPKIMEKRWWKVTAKTEKSGGWLYQAIPSEFQPKFV